MSRLTTYLTCMGIHAHKHSYKCTLRVTDKLGINQAYLGECHDKDCLRCAYSKQVPFEVEEKLNLKE